MDHGSIMELCPDNVKRFPAHISVIVLDNLNGSGLDYTVNENKKKAENRITLEGFKEDFAKQEAGNRFMGLLDQFRSALYCQTALANHWGMPEVTNQIADFVREKARKMNIATLSASQIWTSIKAFKGKDQMSTAGEVKTESENACGSKPDEDVIDWHHYEIGETYQLPYHWDRYIFRLVCYMETSLLHESVKQKIFKMKKIEGLSTAIRKDIEEYRRNLGHDDAGGIPESIVPTRRSYREGTASSRMND